MTSSLVLGEKQQADEEQLRHDFLRKAAKQENQLRKQLPGLFHPSRPTRAPRGPPARPKSKLVAEATAQADQVIEKATTVAEAFEAAPWPSAIVDEEDPNDDEPEPVPFGPDLPAGEQAVAHLLGADTFAVATQRMETVRNEMKGMRVAEPIDPNASRPSPSKRAALIVRQMEADGAPAAEERSRRTVVDEQMREALLRELVEQEADARGALEEFKDRAAYVESEMERVRAELALGGYSHYLTQWHVDTATGEVDGLDGETPPPGARAEPEELFPDERASRADDSGAATSASLSGRPASAQLPPEA